jgi:hypothetical protein
MMRGEAISNTQIYSERNEQFLSQLYWNDRGTMMKSQTQRQPKGEGCPLLGQLGIDGNSGACLSNDASNDEEEPF